MYTLKSQGHMSACSLIVSRKPYEWNINKNIYSCINKCIGIALVTAIESMLLAVQIMTNECVTTDFTRRHGK
jgi:hypothetical protein